MGVFLSKNVLLNRPVFEKTIKHYDDDEVDGARFVMLLVFCALFAVWAAITF